jgi:hypothetical protein
VEFKHRLAVDPRRHFYALRSNYNHDAIILSFDVGERIELLHKGKKMWKGRNRAGQEGFFYPSMVSHTPRWAEHAE